MLVWIVLAIICALQVFPISDANFSRIVWIVLLIVCVLAAFGVLPRL